MPFVESAGYRVFYEEHGSGETILFVGGVTVDHTGFGLQVEPLSRRHRVVVYDNPGVGQTTGPAGPLTTALLAEVAAGLLEALAAGEAHIVGVSMGGAIAQELALDHAASVPLGASALHLGQGRCLPGRAPPQLAGDRARHARHPRPLSRQSEACIAHDALDRVAAISVPTLIAAGENDLLVPPRHSFALHERIPGSLLHLWPGMGHAPWAEIPEAFNRLVEVWVGGAAEGR